ncbi:MAG: NAD-dependent epimerase/dehydratase family protein [Planctomycetaceae bacterium]
MSPPPDPSAHLLVTGASGCVGGAVCLAARARGWRVTGLVREGSEIDWLAAAEVATLPLQLDTPGLCPRLPSGLTHVVHCAARIQAASDADHYQLHVEGLRQLLQGLPPALTRVLLITSLAPLAGRDRTEALEPVALATPGGPLQTLAAAEQLLQEWSRASGVASTIVRPGLVYGPRERWFLPGLLQRLKRGEFRFVGSGEQLLAHTASGNLAHATLLALEHPIAAGRVYHVTDEPALTQRDFIERVAQRAGLPIPRQAVPRRWAELAARPWWWRRANPAFPNPLLLELRWLGWNLPVSLEQCRRDLGYQPLLSTTAALDAALAWYRERNVL